VPGLLIDIFILPLKKHLTLRTNKTFMKIAFVNDCVERLGVEYLSAVLKNAGHDTNLFVDPQLFNDVYIHSNTLGKLFDFKEFLLLQIINYNPDLICFSVDTESYQWACNIAKLVKNNIDVPILFGGIHPSSIPERVISNDFIDIVCIGEGEDAILELVENMKNGIIDHSIKNLWFKKEGGIVQNGIRPLKEDLDLIPRADRTLFFNNSPHFRKGYGTITTRGCPFSCNYCCHSYLKILYRDTNCYYRQRSVRSIIKEIIDDLTLYKTDHIVFFDDCFGFNNEWLKEFSEEYHNTVNMPFICTTYPNIVTENYVKLLKKAGCCSITLGIQSWDSDIQKKWFNRNVSKETMLKAIELILKEGIELVCDNIFDVPFHSHDEYIQTLLNYTIHKPTRINFNQLKYYPNTKITEYSKENRVFSDEDFSNILNGNLQKGIYLNSFSSNDKDKLFIKMSIFLYIMDILPKKLSKYIINNKSYRYFPGFINPAIFMFFRTLFSRDIDAKYFKRRSFVRYNHYFWKILSMKLKKTFKRTRNE